MSYQNITLNHEDKIAILRINRPKKLNALNRETIQELHEALTEIKDDDEIAVVILTGTGEKAFVAGADIAEFADYSVEEGQELAANGQDTLFNFIENFSKPIIVAVNGFALGGGLELAMASHFRTASTNAKMGLPETSLGVIPGYGGTQRLPQLVGKGKAMEMIMTAGMINADEAYRLGLVNHVFEPEDLLEETQKLASKICKNSMVAIKVAIQAVNAGFSYNQDGYAAEIKAFGEAFGTEDFKEGTQAFLNKRKPNFPGQ
ncbi:enoyl-CoA hydratase/isomerase family protein [Flavobacterium sp. CS20]|uniref:enoyl-CoA hydratase/isomerase family protein n=1 Tax=Flavobacterium sp. CS20 TaxID=2775246 RepID=UPI001B3A3757|nr:enoyl-CoA hydratase-related protein [Flavobacterium sp. CS20]QTY28197.1 enoyl-CoA hydratase/isomerase family protein [Flavobacterium sp. CS20]